MEENLIILEARWVAMEAANLVEKMADIQEADFHLELWLH